MFEGYPQEKRRKRGTVSKKSHVVALDILDRRAEPMPPAGKCLRGREPKLLGDRPLGPPLRLTDPNPLEAATVDKVVKAASDHPREEPNRKIGLLQTPCFPASLMPRRN